MSPVLTLRASHRLNAVLAAAMALSLAGIAAGNVVTPVRGMGASLLGSVLSPCGSVDSRFSVNTRPVSQEFHSEPSQLASGSIQILPEVAILPAERPSAPGRGNLPPPIS